MIGSPSLYGHKQREPEASVNFVTCHDGFTLNDLVSYDRKHNEANGEENRDGADDNRSWNCGVEGPTEDPGIDRLRTRQVKNFFTVTMLSAGMPMMGMGDEVRRTQGGNNNAYCQDDETSWFDWTLLAKRADVLRFVSLLNARRTLRNVEHEQQRVALNLLIRQADLSWHGVRLNQPDWGRASHSVAFTTRYPNEGMLFHVILNAFWEPLDFEFPEPLTALDIPGAGGSTPSSRPRTTSSTGNALPWSPAPAIGRSRARWCCCSRTSNRRKRLAPDVHSFGSSNVRSFR